MTDRYKNAFKCAKCPGRGDELGCPAWAEYVERNSHTGEERLTKECVFQALPKLLILTVAASNQAAASADANRNGVVRAIAAATQAAAPGAGLRELTRQPIIKL